MFGVVEATRPDDEHGGSGLGYVLDVTELVARLSKARRWNPKDIRLTFVPSGTQDGASDVKVGRVSYYVR